MTERFSVKGLPGMRCLRCWLERLLEADAAGFAIALCHQPEGSALLIAQVVIKAKQLEMLIIHVQPNRAACFDSGKLLDLLHAPAAKTAALMFGQHRQTVDVEC